MAFVRVLLRQALAVLALAGAAMVPPVLAQETVHYASVSGRVTDPQGAVVPGAQVTARQTETNITREAVTDREGRFRFPYLRIGPYELTVRQPGFAEATRHLTLTVGSAFDLPISLPLERLSETLTIGAAPTVLEAARSQIAVTMSPVEIGNLPLNGRNFLDIALLAPGVSPPNVGGTQLFAETSAVPGVGLSIGSQRNFSNNFIVDGLSANDDAAGLSGMPYGVDAIDQFQVVTSGGQAELGRALGGFVNIVTRSGTNALRADAYAYFRDDRFNAANALLGRRLPMSQKQYGGSVGGPIARNRTFFFANGEHRLLDQSGLTTIPDESVAVVNNRLAEVGYPGSPIATGVYPNPVRSVHALGKVDHQFNGQDQLSLRYSLYDVSARNSRGAGALNAPSASAGLDNRDHTIAVANTLTLSSRTVNETRAQLAYSDLLAPPTDPVGPAVSIVGVAAFGTLSGNPTGRWNRMYQLVNNLSHQAGSHAMRAGVDFLYNTDRITFPRSNRGAYTFSSMATFLAGTYNNSGFTQTFGETEASQGNANIGLFVQDEWRASSNLTLNLGARVDLQMLETVERDTNNVAPRAGFAWTPFGSTKTIVRGSAGLFYDRVPLRAVANALLSAGNTTDIGNLRQVAVSLSPAQAGAPTFPAIMSAVVPTVTLVNLTTTDRNLQNAYSRQASIEIDRQLGEGHTVSVGYQYVRGLHLIMQVNQNVPTCIASGTNNGCRPNSTYANNNQYSSVAGSTYHGLHVSLVKRPSRWAYYRVSYTLSKSMNNVGENFFSSPIDPFDLSKDWGRSDDDQRHRLVINGGVSASMEPAQTALQHLTHGFRLSGTMQAYSALPFNVTSGVTTVQGTAGRPIVDGAFISRNAGIGSDFFSLSARVSRTFAIGRTQLEVLAEVFNLTNRTNVLTRNTNFGTGSYPTNPLPTFGQVTAVGDPRTWQFAVRVRP
jgi:Carboxypeptidase regulatory-like domain/TonB dependent receptor-like, beta-barrel